MQEHTLPTPRTARFVTLGPDDGPVTSVWVVLHGYGQLAPYFARPFASLGGAGRLVVAPEALSRFYLDPGHRRVGASWMTREAREDEIADYVRYLDGVFAAVCARAGVDPQAVPLVVLGFSQGSETATRWLDRSTILDRRPSRAERLILWGNGLPHDLDLRAAGWLAEVDLTLALGDADAYAAPERVEAMEALLRNADVPYRLVRYPGGHRVEPDVLLALAEETDG